MTGGGLFSWRPQGGDERPTDAQRLERARQASLALETFLEPAFETVTAEYLGRMTDLASSTPWEAGKITALANATRIAAEVRSQIAALVMDGEDAKHGMVRAEKIEKLTPARKRLLNIGQF